jgi:hypothetical protein
MVPSPMPNVKVMFPIANTEDAKDKYMGEVVSFHESEANCNTCYFLKRISHKKCRFGFLQGECGLKNDSVIMTFHPHDPMGMPCYKHRDSQ